MPVLLPGVLINEFYSDTRNIVCKVMQRWIVSDMQTYSWINRQCI
jgi:hypothetical protein